MSKLLTNLSFGIYAFLMLITCSQCTNQKVAVIVEPRNHELLVPIVQNAISVLGNSWTIQIFHGLENEEEIKRNFNLEIFEKRIVLNNLKIQNMNIEDYNRLMLNPKFWEQVQGENVLIFQTDSVLCSNSTHKIEEFFNYDYVGAPWNVSISCPEKIAPHMSAIVGNGGLSFRKKSKMIEVLTNLEKTDFNEDVILACLGLRGDLLIPTKEIASTFSVESIFNSNSFGVHKPWRYLSALELDKLGQSCPEVNLILKPFYSKHEKWGQ